ncbi:hypothetical protein OJF2_26440 [Aquisphaera giovannonii]|uniref:DUF1553 domain-containing protein n=1 Tax=Aquisphaera giovannonii TaxID=406548 RepID=A0A5B9W291_9BACT|nr:DUF1549 and DUF1553 domain-containing protein [Aquisphaera giovannonii]QEH34110.1 hypothetical protein OJF2_26440 [Aquisphaera giovannonii]
MQNHGLLPLALLLSCIAPEVRSGPSADGGTSGQRAAMYLAGRIDARLAARWASAKVRPVAAADDGEFLRRACLDLIGKIPTAGEARDFLNDPDPNKRATLIDRLLDSPAYAARAAFLWRQLLLPETDDQFGASPAGLEAWLRKKVDEEAGYDQIVREILSARLAASSNDMAAVATVEPSPTAFYAARGGKPEVVAGDAARAFLGIRVQCAQCHDHPFAKWKREEFWSFAAFFAGVPQQSNDATTVRMNKEDAQRRELTIPGTSKVVKAVHLDHSAPAWRPRAGTREVLAEWVCSPDNPYFARAAVNRVWARFFGEGLIDPVDDLEAEADPALVALLDEVARDFRDHGYNLKYLIRALMATRAYNLSSASGTGTTTATPLFSRMPVRGMSPDQFVDSLAQATGCELGENRARLLELFTERDVPPTESQTSILQALTLMNGAFLSAATKPETGETIGAIAEAPYLDTAGRVEMVFLAALSRQPRSEERSLAIRYIDGRATEADRAKALSDVFWALLNGPEFRTNH